MKKLSLLSILLISATMLFAQGQNAALPRWGSGPPQNDNTGRVLSYAVVPVATTSTTATLSQTPKAFETVYTIPISHALSDSINSVFSYVGDRVVFIFTADASQRVVTFSGSMHTTGTVTVGANYTATITFRYLGGGAAATAGGGWVEVGRAVNTD